MAAQEVHETKASPSPSTAWAEESESEEEEEGEEEDDGEEYEGWNHFPGLAVQLGNGGIILVLLETPSGFALFSYDGLKLLSPRAIEHIWTDFVKCDRAKTDKASAINLDTGVDERLATMIKKHIEPGQKLAVGCPEYKKIIEENLGMACLYDDTVMEVMWGLKNCMHHLVPGELSRDHHALMSEGMKIALDKYGFDYKPESINDHIIVVACLVYNCDYSVDKHSESLNKAGEHLKNISGIDSEGWDLLKLASALKMICDPQEELLTGDPRQQLLRLHDQHFPGSLRRLAGEELPPTLDSDKYFDDYDSNQSSTCAQLAVEFYNQQQGYLAISLERAKDSHKFFSEGTAYFHVIFKAAADLATPSSPRSWALKASPREPPWSSSSTPKRNAGPGTTACTAPASAIPRREDLLVTAAFRIISNHHKQQVMMAMRRSAVAMRTERMLMRAAAATATSRRAAATNHIAQSSIARE